MRKSRSKYSGLEAAILDGVTGAVCVGLIVADASCTQSQAQTATNIAVQVTSDLCTELNSQDAAPVPGFVTLLCKATNEVGQLVQVVISADQWATIKSSGLKPKAAGSGG